MVAASSFLYAATTIGVAFGASIILASHAFASQIASVALANVLKAAVLASAASRAAAHVSGIALDVIIDISR